MLGSLEQMIVAAVTPRLEGDDPAVTVLAGVTEPPAASTSSVLGVLASGLRQVVGADDGATAREPATRSRTLSVQPDTAHDPSGRTFRIATADFDEAAEQVAEVYTEDNRRLRLGEACIVEGRTIRCLREQTGDLQLRLVGRPSAGYVERRACEIEISITAWGCPNSRWQEEVEAADRLLAIGVGAALESFLEVDAVDLVDQDDRGFEVRLLRPRAALVSATRGPRPVADAPVMCAQATILVSGELVTTLAGAVRDDGAGAIRAARLDALTVNERVVALAAVKGG